LGHVIEVATVPRERGVFLRSLTEGFDTSTYDVWAPPQSSSAVSSKSVPSPA
jgi:hypothetical protein